MKLFLHYSSTYQIFLFMTMCLVVTGVCAQDFSKTCEYNPKNQVFTDNYGNKVQVHFARHASPSSVYKFWDEMAVVAVDDKIESLKVARKLIETNKEQSLNMVKYSNYVLSQLQMNKLSWLGIENSQKYIQSYGILERCIASETNKKTFKGFGLSDDEVDLLMVNLEGADGYAYCRWVNSFSSNKPTISNPKMLTRKEAISTVTLMGIDNDRLPAMDKLQARISERQKQLAKVKKAREIKTIVEEVESLYSQKDALMKKEMDLRDNGIARDVLTAAENHSNDKRQGVVVLGSFHEKGVLRELVQQCKMKLVSDSKEVKNYTDKKANRSKVAK